MPNETTELCDLAFKYGTDKCPRIKHPFTPFYYELLKHRRGSIKKVVEIGVGAKRRHSNSPDNRMGAGLYMWRDFFPKAKIFGADIDPQVMFKDERIKTILCDQSSKKDLLALIKKTGANIDLFIDDASHVPEHQVFTCLTLMPLLKKSVIYVIEDVLDPTIAVCLHEYDWKMTDRLGKHHDDRLIIVKHRA